MSPAVLSLFGPDLESVLFSVLETAEGCGVDCAEVLPSNPLPFRVGSEGWSSLILDIIADFATGFTAGFDTGIAAGGAYLAVLLYAELSSRILCRLVPSHIP